MARLHQFRADAASRSAGNAMRYQAPTVEKNNETIAGQLPIRDRRPVSHR